MSNQRTIEIFSAGCPACDEAVAQVKAESCASCDVQVLDMHDPATAARAKNLGIRSVPAVVIDGQLAGCCAGRGVDLVVLREAGLGQPLA